MKSTVEFPNLFTGGFQMNRSAFSLLGNEIYWYGILITLGVILGILYALKRARFFGMIPDHVFDTAFAGAIGGFIGARIYYCLFSANTDYTIITAITNIRDGGLAIYGGVIGGVVTAFVFSRIRKIHFLPIMDLAGLGFLIGQGIGRWGNFVNQECFGAPTAGGLPWGMTGDIIAASPEVIKAQAGLPAGEYALVHPCFLYESLWCFLGLLILHFYSKKHRSFDGEIFLLYAVWYGTGRGFIEGLRTDSLYAGEVKVSQIVGFVSAAVALLLFIYFKITLAKKKDYVMLSLDEENKFRVENYANELKLIKEKKEAKKALNSFRGEIAPSILPEEENHD